MSSKLSLPRVVLTLPSRSARARLQRGTGDDDRRALPGAVRRTLVAYALIAGLPIATLGACDLVREAEGDTDGAASAGTSGEEAAWPDSCDAALDASTPSADRDAAAQACADAANATRCAGTDLASCQGTDAANGEALACRWFDRYVGAPADATCGGTRDQVCRVGSFGGGDISLGHFAAQRSDGTAEVLLNAPDGGYEYDPLGYERFACDGKPDVCACMP